jgi:hypothetical protein
MGLTRNDNSKRDSYYAYRTLSEQLGDYTLVQHLFGSDHPADGVQGFLFASALGKKLVVWNVSGLQNAITFTDNSNTAKAVDALGRLFPITKVSSGKYQIKVGARPIYISGAFLDKPTGIEVFN